MSYSITIWTADGEEREYGGFKTRDEAEEEMDGILAADPEYYTGACVSKD